MSKILVVANANIARRTKDNAFIATNSFGDSSNYAQFSTTGDLTFSGTAGLPYGNMYIYTLSGGGPTVTVSATDTWYMVGSGVSGGLTNGFTFQNNRELLASVAGKYRIVWSMSVSSTVNNELEGTIIVSGAANTSLASMSIMGTANKPIVLSGSGIVSLGATDTVALAVLNNTATNNIVIDHMTMTISMVGGS
jgi:hypothetical protein